MARNSFFIGRTDGDHPGVIAPPPLVFAGLLGVGLLINAALAWTLGLAALARMIGGGLMLGIGASFLAAALGLFRRARTRPEPWQPTTAIVTTGVYSVTRNPMYVGMALAYAGIAVLADAPAALLLLPLVLIVIDVGVIRREERYLEAKFGSEYLRYKAQVRRWL